MERWLRDKGRNNRNMCYRNKNENKILEMIIVFKYQILSSIFEKKKNVLRHRKWKK